MASFNQISIVGYLGKNAEMRYTPQGTAVLNFSIATTERRKDSRGEFTDITTWFKVSLWGKQAEALTEYLTKGRQVYVAGRLRSETYTARDGQQRTNLEVMASDVQILGTKSDGTAPAMSPVSNAAKIASITSSPTETYAEVDADDIPF